ncbi:peroxidase 45-like [Typha angustifolia]|uniref:peroxidase 45-like n=1 Tax=Typha angustifolia TaxID=59011 RepID=UPI003C2F14C8
MEGLQVILLSCLLTFLFISPMATAQLSPSYYANICPNLETIVHDVIKQKSGESVIVAPGVLRLYFHDCFVNGCDASIMLISPTQDDEWHSPDDMSLTAEGFNAIVSAKVAVDSDPQCNSKVSCADILAIAARDVVSLKGGPLYTVELGRLDGKISTKDSVVLPHPNFDLDQLNAMFAKFNLTQTDMVALSGAHTFGVAHCEKFWYRLYNYSSTVKTDPSLDPGFAAFLMQQCPQQYNPISFVFLDAVNPLNFDNGYYVALQQGRGLLGSDEVLYTDSRSKGTVDLFASNQATFYDAFVTAITKLGRIGIKNTTDGEIRLDCSKVN